MAEETLLKKLKEAKKLIAEGILDSAQSIVTDLNSADPKDRNLAYKALADFNKGISALGEEEDEVEQGKFADVMKEDLTAFCKKVYERSCVLCKE